MLRGGCRLDWPSVSEDIGLLFNLPLTQQSIKPGIFLAKATTLTVMEEFRKLMNFLLLVLTTFTLKKTASSDLSAYIPTLSVRHASQSLYELWDKPFTSYTSSPMIKLSIRRKISPDDVASTVHGRYSVVAHNHTPLTSRSYDNWLVEQTQTIFPRIATPVKQLHQGVVIIFRRHNRILALILSDLVADAFKAAWHSPICRRLIDFIARWGYTLAFWLSSIAGPENVFAFEQFRAALYRRCGKHRRQITTIPASIPFLLMPPTSPSRSAPRLRRIRKTVGQSPIQGFVSKAPGVKPIQHKSQLALDLEHQLDSALRLAYVLPSLANLVPEPLAAEESLTALELVSLLDDPFEVVTPDCDVAAEMQERMRPYLPPASDEEPETMIVAKRDGVSLQTTRIAKRPRRSVEELVGQVIKVPKELTEEEKEEQEEKRRRRATFVRTFLYTSVPRMAPRYPPVSLNTPYMLSANTAVEEGRMAAFTLPPRFVDAAPPVLLRRGAKSLIIIRKADASEPARFKGVRQEMKALRLLAECEWAARLVCYCSLREHVEVQLRYYPPQRSFKSMIKRNGGFLSFRVAVFYLAELIAALQAFQSYGLIHTDISIDDLTMSPRGDVIIQNFDKSEIFYGGRLPHWIPRHENFFAQKPTGYDDYVRVVYLYYEMLTGLNLDGGIGPLSRNRKRNDNRMQEPRTVDFDFIHFVTGTYPLTVRSVQSIVDHPLFKEINWRAIQGQSAAVPICHKTLQELKT